MHKLSYIILIWCILLCSCSKSDEPAKGTVCIDDLAKVLCPEVQDRLRATDSIGCNLVIVTQPSVPFGSIQARMQHLRDSIVFFNPAFEENGVLILVSCRPNCVYTSFGTDVGDIPLSRYGFGSKEYQQIQLSDTITLPNKVLSITGMALTSWNNAQSGFLQSLKSGILDKLDSFIMPNSGSFYCNVVRPAQWPLRQLCRVFGKWISIIIITLFFWWFYRFPCQRFCTWLSSQITQVILLKIVPKKNTERGWITVNSITASLLDNVVLFLAFIAPVVLAAFSLVTEESIFGMEFLADKINYGHLRLEDLADTGTDFGCYSFGWSTLVLLLFVHKNITAHLYWGAGNYVLKDVFIGSFAYLLPASMCICLSIMLVPRVFHSFKLTNPNINDQISGSDQNTTQSNNWVTYIEFLGIIAVSIISFGISGPQKRFSRICLDPVSSSTIALQHGPTDDINAWLQNGKTMEQVPSVYDGSLVRWMGNQVDCVWLIMHNDSVEKKSIVLMPQEYKSMRRHYVRNGWIVDYDIPCTRHDDWQDSISYQDGYFLNKMYHAAIIYNGRQYFVVAPQSTKACSVSSGYPIFYSMPEEMIKENFPSAQAIKDPGPITKKAIWITIIIFLCLFVFLLLYFTFGGDSPESANRGWKEIFCSDNVILVALLSLGISTVLFPIILWILYIM